MSFQKSTPDLKNEVLKICGELQDGTSSFETSAVGYLNDLYRGLYAGGNEFGIDVGEPWVWAQAKNPVLLELLPTFTTGSVTMTNGTLTVDFSDSTADSLLGYWIRLDGQSEFYRLVSQDTIIATRYQLDQYFLGTTTTTTFRAFPLEYAVNNDILIVDSSNKYINFKEAASSMLTATIAEGVYSLATYVQAVKAALEAATTVAATYTVSFSSLTRLFTISTSGSVLEFYFATGTSNYRSASDMLGFDIDDYTGATSYTSSYVLTGISRLTKPLAMHREVPTTFTNAKDIGKIFIVDDNAFLREFPLSRIQNAFPDRCCISEYSPSGLMKLKFNNCGDESIRAEVNYIPVPKDLIDNAASFPRVPGAGVKYLVYGAAHYLLLDKSDNKSDKFAQLATAKLQAMVADNRKNLTLGGKDFGRLIARRGQMRIWNWNQS